MEPIELAKLVDFECPRCGVQSRIAIGLRDVDTGQIVDMPCSKCGLEFDFERKPPVSAVVK